MFILKSKYKANLPFFIYNLKKFHCELLPLHNRHLADYLPPASF